MPIREYECRKCGHRFETIQRFGEAPLKTCRHNGCAGRVERLLSVPNVIYKGSGFYTTDYARKGEQKSDLDPSSKKSDLDLSSKKTDSDTKKDNSPEKDD